MYYVYIGERQFEGKKGRDGILFTLIIMKAKKKVSHCVSRTKFMMFRLSTKTIYTCGVGIHNLI